LRGRGRINKWYEGVFGKSIAKGGDPKSTKKKYKKKFLASS